MSLDSLPIISLLGNAPVVSFPEGAAVVIKPYKKYITAVEGLDSVVLYQNKRLVAQATEAPGYARESEQFRFWSPGAVTQPELARHWRRAQEAIEQQLDRPYRADSLAPELMPLYRHAHFALWAGHTLLLRLERADLAVAPNDPQWFVEELPVAQLSLPREGRPFLS